MPDCDAMLQAELTMDHSSWTPPPLAEVEALHERYLHEIVVQRNVCPFAQRSIEMGRVNRLWWTQPSANHDLETIAQRFAAHVQDRELEIVLLSFVLPPNDPHQELSHFEDWHRQFRLALKSLQIDEHWYSVCFHPRSGDETLSRSTPARFVSLLRRTPDPVIQCVRVTTLEEVRQKAQATAQKQLIESLAAKDPALALVAKSCVMTDSQLSNSIARKNHEQWAQDPGWSQLAAGLDSIVRARRALDERA